MIKVGYSVDAKIALAFETPLFIPIFMASLTEEGAHAAVNSAESKTKCSA